MIQFYRSTAATNHRKSLRENRQEIKKSKVYYYSKTKELLQLGIGQSVAVQLNLDKNYLWKSGKIQGKLKDRDYLINVDDRLCRRNLFHIKPFLSNQNNTTKEISG